MLRCWRNGVVNLLRADCLSQSPLKSALGKKLFIGSVSITIEKIGFALNSALGSCCSVARAEEFFQLEMGEREVE